MNAIAFSQDMNCVSRRSGRRGHSVHKIEYTDRIYACLTLAGQIVAELTRDRVTDFSALLCMLRAATPSLRGLARLRVRNMTRGWTMERPLMLYPDTAS